MDRPVRNLRCVPAATPGGGVTLRALLLLGVLACGAVPAHAQIGTTSGTGVSYQYFGFFDPDAARTTSLRLLTVPFAARSDLVGRIRVDIAGAYARGVLERSDGTEATISGMTDTQVRLVVPVVGNLVTVTGLMVLPTGISTATPEEAEVAGTIASDLLPMRISNWGGGGGGGVGATLTHSFGPYAIGGGASYIVSSEFAPIETEELATYQPGDQLSVQLVASRDLSRSDKLSLQLVYQHQSEDQSLGQNLFRSGDRVQAIASYAFRVSRTAAGILYGGGQYRERGAALLELMRDAPSQTLVLFGGGLRLPGNRVVVAPSADFRLLRSQDGVSQGYVGGVGIAAEWPVGGFQMGPQLRMNAGNLLVREGEQSGVFGGEVGFTVRLSR